MQTEFKQYLEKKQAQKKIDKLAKKYEGKRVVLYGAGMFACELLKDYDFSKLNITAVADKKFEDNREGDFYGYKKLAPLDLLEEEFEVLVFTLFDTSEIKEDVKEMLEDADRPKVKFEVLVNMNLIEYIKYLWSMD